MIICLRIRRGWLLLHNKNTKHAFLSKDDLLVLHECRAPTAPVLADADVKSHAQECSVRNAQSGWACAVTPTG